MDRARFDSVAYSWWDGWVGRADMGRPTKFNADVQQRICEAVELGATYEDAAEYVGIAYETLRDWSNKNPVFSAALRASVGKATLGWLELIERAAVDDWRAAAWKLERRHPQRWGPRERIEVAHSGGVDVQVLATMRTAVAQVFPDDPDAPIRLADALAAI